MVQSKVKHLTAAKDNKYRLLYKVSESRGAEMERQKEKLQALYSVIQKLNEECSHPLLYALSTQLKTRMN